MNRRTAPRLLTTVGILAMVVAGIGFIVSLVLNAFLFDDYDAYGDVQIPGQSSVHLPAGDVEVTFHTLLIGSGGGNLPTPDLQIRIAPPKGVEVPALGQDLGSTTTVNNDSRRRIGYLQVAVEGDYDIQVEGNANGYASPGLAFGHGSRWGILPWIFGVTFGLGVVTTIIARLWAARVRRMPVFDQPPPPPVADFGSTPTWSPGDDVPPQQAAPTVPNMPTQHASTVPNLLTQQAVPNVPIQEAAPTQHAVPPVPSQPAVPFTPSDEGIREQTLNTLARLRDSGALTEDEYEAEKKRVLEGH